MTTEEQIAIAKKIIEGGICTKVFHSAELIRDPTRGPLYPAYPKGAEYLYMGPDDTKGFFAYIRSNGNYSSVPLPTSSCQKSYEIQVPLRVVFFHDSDNRDRNFLLTKLAPFTFMQNVRLVQVIDDKFRLIREESPRFSEHFDAKTFFAAFDILVKKILLSSECEQMPCDPVTNPICKL